MKHPFILILCCLFPGLLICQDVQFQWAKNLGPGINEHSIAVATDQSGNVYNTGLFMQTVDMDPGPGVYNLTSSGYADIFIAKYNAAGNFIWAKQIGNGESSVESVRGMAVDPAGNVFITGEFQGAFDFDPGPGVHTITSAGSGYSAYLLHLNTNGNFVWAKNIAQSSSGNIGYNVTVAASGNIYVLGTFNGLTDFDPGAGVSNISSTSTGQDIFVSKFTAAGNFIWSRQFLGNMGALGSGIKVDAAENVYTTGPFAGTIDFDPGAGVVNLTANTQLTASAMDVFVHKMDLNGNLIWVRQIAGDKDDVSQELAVDPTGNIYITGRFEGLSDFDPGAGTFMMDAEKDPKAFILKLTSNGAFVWAKQFVGPLRSYSEGLSIACDLLGEVYITGNFYGTIDFDPGSAVFNLSGSDASSSLFITKLHADGSFLFAKSISSSQNNNPVVGSCVYVDAFQNIYLSGYYRGDTDFDPNSGEYMLSTTSYTDAFITKLSQCLQRTSSSITATICSSYTLNNQTYTESGTYTQLLQNAAGCDSIITLQLTIWGALIHDTVTICNGQSYFAGGTQQTSSGIYRDSFVTAQGCDSVRVTHLTVRNKLLPDLGADKLICAGAQLSPGKFNAYEWQDGSDGATFSAMNKGIYWVKVTDVYHCMATDSIEITGILPAPANFLKATDSICTLERIQLQPNQNFKEYNWSTGSQQFTTTINQPGRYILEVTDQKGCYGKDTVTVYPRTCRPGVHIPTAFSPNGDQKNDELRAFVYGELVSFRLQIFNRWGEIIFMTTDPFKGWDGTIKGKAADTGVYIWRCQSQLQGERAFETKGTVTLIR